MITPIPQCKMLPVKTARKSFRCFDCGKPIDKGSQYRDVGTFLKWHYPRCPKQ